MVFICLYKKKLFFNYRKYQRFRFKKHKKRNKFSIIYRNQKNSEKRMNY